MRFSKQVKSSMLLDKNSVKADCLNKTRDEWLAAKHTFPGFLAGISKETKAQNEQYIQTISDDFRKLLKSFPINPNGREQWKKKTTTLLEAVFCEETIIGIHHSMDQKTLAAFQDELKDFLRHVREFAPELSLEGIGQAIRNYIVYAMFKEINQVKSCFSMACFGYSMLYPFTDNYIDSEKNSDKEKTEYNQIIRDKIEGKDVQPKSLHQLRTCQLLQMIESEYPGKRDSSIFVLLLMMLEAQEGSLRQQNKILTLTPAERLDISLYKGGLSVLIDRLFVNKEITENDLVFYFEFGFFLQLADDLQDIKEDSIQGNQTIFTGDPHSKREEEIVNKLLHFVQRIFDAYQAENDSYKHFILSNCYQLIYSSIVRSKAFFSKEYLDKLEKYLPVTYQFLENIKMNQIDKKDIKTQDKYMRILDEMIK